MQNELQQYKQDQISQKQKVVIGKLNIGFAKMKFTPRKESRYSLTF